MEIGEIIGLVFLLGVLVSFGIYFYRANLCPKCGGFRTMKTVSVEQTPLDTETDALELIVDMIDGQSGRHKSDLVKWVDRCSKCGYETENKQVTWHH